MSRRSPSSVPSSRSTSPFDVIISRSAATPRSASTSRHDRNNWPRSSVPVSPESASRRGVQPTNGVSAAARTSPARCGCSSARSRHSQSRAVGARNTLRLPGEYRGDTRRGKRVADHCRLVVRPHQHGDVAWRDWLRLTVQVQPAGSVEQPDDVGRDVFGDDPARHLRCDLRAVGNVRKRSTNNAQPQRGSGAVEPRCPGTQPRPIPVFARRPALRRGTALLAR